MAFFKFRKRGDDQAATAAPPESIEAMRKRARHRLVGAVILVLIGVIGFPLLFDRQPRPIAVDIPIDIPDRNKTKPLSIPLPPPSPVATGPVTTTPAPAPAVASVVASVAAPAAPASAPAERKEALAAAKVEDKTAKPAAAAALAPAKTAAKPESAPKPADKAAVAAAPAGTTVEKKAAAADERFVVQVGAFADVTKARAARLKLEQAGLKTYTQVVQTKEGRRIRVRVGPFAGKAEADLAAEKIKKLDLPAAILTL